MDLSETDYKEKIIEQVIEITNCSKKDAIFLLESNGWNLSETLVNYLENNKNSEKKTYKSNSNDHLKTENHHRFKTFNDISKEESDTEDEKQSNLYSGGKKSAVFIQHPKSDKKNVIEEILEKASKNRYKEPDEFSMPSTLSKFSGTGYVLGSEDEVSRKVPDPTELDAHKPPAKVTRDLTFWKDGFTIGDGPLMRYDDPSNAANLQAINSGHAPLSLLNVEVGQEVDLRVQKKLDKEYQPPKKYIPFSGTGQRLGSPTPKVIGSKQKEASECTNNDKKIVYQHKIDETFPVTTLQIRFGDGTKHLVKFNLSHTIGDVYDFVNINGTDDSRNYILQTIFPNKEYVDKSLNLKDAGLLNAVLVQKFI